jgi:peptidoglycan/xylan/chitin deacetylase (PgdA/CDA1 family)
MSASAPWSRWRGAYVRRISRWFGQRRCDLLPSRPLVSFTFDDFPRSALTTGAAILEGEGVLGTYYVALGLAGQTIATGRMFERDNLANLVGRGHELGCHTFHHCPAWETPVAEYLSSVERNAAAFAALPTPVRPDSHSYPISYPRPASKRQLQRRFRACRLGGQTFNHGPSDLNALASFFLEQSLNRFDSIERLLAENAARSGWLIFSTHDIAPDHTPYGCPPGFFSRVVRAARESGAALVTVSRALDELGVPPAGAGR